MVLIILIILYIAGIASRRLILNVYKLSNKAKGEMILGLPGEEEKREAIIRYFRERGLTVTEVRDYA